MTVTFQQGVTAADIKVVGQEEMDKSSIQAAQKWMQGGTAGWEVGAPDVDKRGSLITWNAT